MKVPLTHPLPLLETVMDRDRDTVVHTDTEVVLVPDWVPVVHTEPEVVGEKVLEEVPLLEREGEGVPEPVKQELDVKEPLLQEEGVRDRE